MSLPKPVHRPDIEGLRGVAILLVVLFHAGVSWVAGGFVGVDVFFVMSGYFITGLLVREQLETGAINLTEFYARRALRLLPSQLLVLVVTLAAVMLLYAPIDRAPIAANARAVALSSGNIAFASGSVDYFSNGDSPYLHTWSLAVEQQFYFFWPLLFVLACLVWDIQRVADGTDTAKARKRILTSIGVLGALSFVGSLWLTRHAQPWAFFGMPTRVWEFAIGGALAVSLGTRETVVDDRAGWLQLAGLAMIALGVAMYDRATPYPGVAALLPALGGLALLAGGHFAPGSILSLALGMRWLRWLGQLSYTWYLWHWPLVAIGGVINPLIGVWGKLAWCLLALVLAWLTHRYVERPAREGSWSLFPAERISQVSIAAGAIAALLAYGATVMAERRAGQPDQRPFLAARDDRIDHGCWASTASPVTSPCAFGDTTSRTTVVLFGDSHAEHWLGALDRAGRERKWKVVLMVMGGCPVAEMSSFKHARLKRQYDECAQFREATMQRIVAMKPAAAILSSFDHYVPADGEGFAWQVTPHMWREGLRRTYSRLSQAGIPLVALRGTPRTRFDVPACLSRRAAHVPFASPCEYSMASSLLPAAVAAQSEAARGLRMQLVDMNDQLCATTTCAVVKNGQIVFTDDNHLTLSFSRTLARPFGNRIAAALAALGAPLP